MRVVHTGGKRNVNGEVTRSEDQGTEEFTEQGNDDRRTVRESLCGDGGGEGVGDIVGADS